MGERPWERGCFETRNSIQLILIEILFKLNVKVPVVGNTADTLGFHYYIPISFEYIPRIHYLNYSRPAGLVAQIEHR